jgi:hypothetical protein
MIAKAPSSRADGGLRGGLRSLRPHVRRTPFSAHRHDSTPSSSGKPATVITTAGVHGGAGTTTVCLLLAHVIDTAAGNPSLVVDLADHGRGGLALLGGAGTRATAEQIAAAAVHHARGVEAFAVNRAGVRIVGALPHTIERLERNDETLIAQIIATVESAADDTELAQDLRAALVNYRARHALRWDTGEAAAAVGTFLQAAVLHHSFLGIDLGALESDTFAALAAEHADSHLWVVPGRQHSIEAAAQKLPELPPVNVRGEAIAVWQTDEPLPSPKVLSALGDTRGGVPVIRMANHGSALDPWSAKVERCRTALDEMLRLGVPRR